MIEREEREWGVRLVATPFRGAGKNIFMEIQAEVRKPTGQQQPNIRIVFHGVPPRNPLLPVDARIWITAMQAVLEEAGRVADQMRLKPTRKKPKKISNKR